MEEEQASAASNQESSQKRSALFPLDMSLEVSPIISKDRLTKLSFNVGFSRVGFKQELGGKQKKNKGAKENDSEESNNKDVIKTTGLLRLKPTKSGKKKHKIDFRIILTCLKKREKHPGFSESEESEKETGFMNELLEEKMQDELEKDADMILKKMTANSSKKEGGDLAKTNGNQTIQKATPNRGNEEELNQMEEEPNALSKEQDIQKLQVEDESVSFPNQRADLDIYERSAVANESQKIKNPLSTVASLNEDELKAGNPLSETLMPVKIDQDLQESELISLANEKPFASRLRDKNKKPIQSAPVPASKKGKVEEETPKKKETILVISVGLPLKKTYNKARLNRFGSEKNIKGRSDKRKGSPSPTVPQKKSDSEGLGKRKKVKKKMEANLFKPLKQKSSIDKKKILTASQKLKAIGRRAYTRDSISEDTQSIADQESRRKPKKRVFEPSSAPAESQGREDEKEYLASILQGMSNVRRKAILSILCFFGMDFGDIDEFWTKLCNFTDPCLFKIYKSTPGAKYQAFEYFMALIHVMKNHERLPKIILDQWFFGLDIEEINIKLISLTIMKFKYVRGFKKKAEDFCIDSDFYTSKMIKSLIQTNKNVAGQPRLPFECPIWTNYDDYCLLKGVFDFGFGNWAQIISSESLWEKQIKTPGGKLSVVFMLFRKVENEEIPLEEFQRKQMADVTQYVQTWVKYQANNLMNLAYESP